MVYYIFVFLICLLKLKPSSNVCPLLDKRIFYVHKGGDTDLYHENTLEIFRSSAKQGFSIEMDLIQLKSGEVICFHDKDFSVKAGVDLKVKHATWEEVKNIKYMKTYHDKEYSNTASIPLLSEAINEICNLNDTAGIWLDIKTRLDSNNAIAILKAFDNSPCTCNEKQNLVVEVHNQPWGVILFKNLMKNFRCKNFLFAFSFYNYDVTYGYEDLKSKMDYYSSYADILDIEESIIYSYPQLINYFHNQGICTSIFGEKNVINIYKKFPIINIMIANYEDLRYNKRKKSESRFNMKNKILKYFSQKKEGKRK